MLLQQSRKYLHSVLTTAKVQASSTFRRNLSLLHFHAIIYLLGTCKSHRADATPEGRKELLLIFFIHSFAFFLCLTPEPTRRNTRPASDQCYPPRPCCDRLSDTCSNHLRIFVSSKIDLRVDREQLHAQPPTTLLRHCYGQRFVPETAHELAAVCFPTLAERRNPRSTRSPTGFWKPIFRAPIFRYRTPTGVRDLATTSSTASLSKHIATTDVESWARWHQQLLD